jgi:hypothetical protein
VRVIGSPVLVVVLASSISGYPKNTLPLPGCEAPPDVRAAFESKLAQDSLAKLKIKERVALQQQVIGELLAKYPREYSLYEQQIGVAKQQQMYVSDQSSADEFISREDGLAALDSYLQAMEEYGGYGTLSFMPADPPRFLLDHGWQPVRALELLKKSTTYKDGGHSKVDWEDDIGESDLKRFERYLESEDRATLVLSPRTMARYSSCYRSAVGSLRQSVAVHSERSRWPSGKTSHVESHPVRRSVR